ncbi:MAG: hypothetical protein JNM36_15650 [Chitinophagales bacterium]|jgi:hypothetical protein|nr:hypothetical protein [Chitinophagales bacterium]
MGIPKIISSICSYIADRNLVLTQRFDDGRVNAAFNEEELIKEIKQNFSIEVPPKRAWYDFSIVDQGEFYPINIKITDTTHADNLNCKLGIYYALTGILPDFANEIAWEDFFQKLHANIGTYQSKDYYFLVFNKRMPTDVFANALKGLQTLQPNGNNLPFQCKWDSNRQYQTRTFAEAKDIILSKLGESISLRASIYRNFANYFPQYV